jgi:hypothetical protein
LPGGWDQFNVIPANKMSTTTKVTIDEIGPNDCAVSISYDRLVNCQTEKRLDVLFKNLYEFLSGTVGSALFSNNIFETSVLCIWCDTISARPCRPSDSPSPLVYRRNARSRHNFRSFGRAVEHTVGPATTEGVLLTMHDFRPTHVSTDNGQEKGACGRTGLQHSCAAWTTKCIHSRQHSSRHRSQHSTRWPAIRCLRRFV